MLTYRNSDEFDRDKAQLTRLLDALHAWPSALRRDDVGLWILRVGRRGWQGAQRAGDQPATMGPRFKKRLAFAEVTQDGDQEGCFRLHRLFFDDSANKIAGANRQHPAFSRVQHQFG